MAITTSIEITNIQAKKTLGGKDHVIESINFNVAATDGTYSHQMNGVQYIDFDPNSFIEWADTPEFEAQVIEWTKPYSDELIAECTSVVTELAKDEDETLSFTS
tara:strand:+ start:335 stop:646 length:312 start_codon:yes stop_codon:yes gene_type:complete